MNPLAALQHHVSGAIERGEKEAIACVPVKPSLKILSIDAWKTKYGWTWNNWYKLGEIDKEVYESLVTTRQILAWMREEGYLSEFSKGRVTIQDDQYNLVIVNKNTQEPLYAIEYGPAY